MFTGLIEDVGTIQGRQPNGGGVQLTIGASGFADDLTPGESVAVDGVCLTVIEAGEGVFAVQAVGTTLRRTILGGYVEGRRVNLERALSVGARLGGHLVQGHVDGVGHVRSVERRGDLVLIDFTLPEVVAEVTVLHGSIALNGVSLTVNALHAAGRAQVSIIPFTWSHTALADLVPDDAVNLEGDLIGKYVRHLLGAPTHGADAAGSPGRPDLLRRWGYGSDE